MDLMQKRRVPKMSWGWMRNGVLCVLVAALSLAVSGCGKLPDAVTYSLAATETGTVVMASHLYRRASNQFLQQRYAEAEESVREALALLEKGAPDASGWIGACSYLLGVIVKNDAARLDEAVEALQRAVPLFEAQGEAGQEHLVMTLGHLGEALVMRGDIDEAETLLRRALELTDQGGSYEDVKTYAKCLHNMGTICIHQGQLDKASGFFDRALAELEKRGETESREGADSMNGKAYVLYKKGEYEAARSLMTEAVELAERVLGGGSPMLAKMSFDLACACQRAEDYDEARRLHTRALSIFTDCFGSESKEAQRVQQALHELQEPDGGAEEKR